MNTIAWAIEGRNDSRDVYAFYGATALWISKGLDSGDSVWQYAPEKGRDEAIRYLTEITGYLERKGWTIQGEPVEFDLSDEAIAQILPHGGEGKWIYAPTLRAELMMEVARPGWTGVLTGMAPPDPDWVSVGYVEKGFTMWPTSTPPTHPAVGDIWIEP